MLLVHVDLASNIHRFCSVALATSRFSKPRLVRGWGQIGGMRWERTDCHNGPETAQAMLERLAPAKRR